jgi:uncharacterized metal-binding protein
MVSCRFFRRFVVCSSFIKILLLYPAEPNRGMRYDPLLGTVLSFFVVSLLILMLLFYALSQICKVGVQEFHLF